MINSLALVDECILFIPNFNESGKELYLIEFLESDNVAAHDRVVVFVAAIMNSAVDCSFEILSQHWISYF